MRNASDKSCRENQNKYFILIISLFLKKIVPFRKDVEKYDRARQPTDDDIIRRMNLSCWIATPTNSHSEYVIVIGFSTAVVVMRTRVILTLCVQ